MSVDCAVAGFLLLQPTGRWLAGCSVGRRRVGRSRDLVKICGAQRGRLCLCDCAYGISETLVGAVRFPDHLINDRCSDRIARCVSSRGPYTVADLEKPAVRFVQKSFFSLSYKKGFFLLAFFSSATATGICSSTRFSCSSSSCTYSYAFCRSLWSVVLSSIYIMNLLLYTRSRIGGLRFASRQLVC